MKLVKATASNETVTIELTFDELLLLSDMISDSQETYECDDLYDTMLNDFNKLSTDLLIFDNALRNLGLK